MTSSNVTHPSHYNSGKIEVIEFIEDLGFGPAFCRGNAIKYLARAGKKDPSKEIEDLEKAQWYVNREIEQLKAKKEGREPVRPNDMNPKTSATRFECKKPECIAQGWERWECWENRHADQKNSLYSRCERLVLSAQSLTLKIRDHDTHINSVISMSARDVDGHLSDILHAIKGGT